MTNPSTLADFTSPGLIVPRLQTSRPIDIIAELSAVLQRQGHLEGAQGFCDAVVARELMSPTAIPLGWAVPHARLGGLAQLSFCFGRTREPLAWFGNSRFPVRIVFLFAVPETQSKAYLDVVSAVAKLSRNEQLVERLLQEPDAGALFQIFRQTPLRRSATPAPVAVPAGLPSH